MEDLETDADGHAKFNMDKFLAERRRDLETQYRGLGSQIIITIENIRFLGLILIAGIFFLGSRIQGPKWASYEGYSTAMLVLGTYYQYLRFMEDSMKDNIGRMGDVVYSIFKDSIRQLGLPTSESWAQQIESAGRRRLIKEFWEMMGRTIRDGMGWSCMLAGAVLAAWAVRV